MSLSSKSNNVIICFVEKFKLAILASGGGTTAEAIIKSGVVEVVLVITNNKDALVLEKAKRLGIPTKVLPRAPYKVFKDGEEDIEASKLNYGEAILEKLSEFNVTHISQNGWMVLTPKNVIESYAGRIVNQHPGPLDPGYPDFGGEGMYGLRVHAAVLNFTRSINRPFKYTEATIHQVNEEYDKGPLLLTRQVEIKQGEGAETLAERILPVEHQLQIEFWEKVQNGGVEPFQRDSRLILSTEVEILEKAKTDAIEKYPHG